MKKLIVVFILLMAFAGTVMGQTDLSKFPDPVEPWNFLLSIGFGYGGANITADYGGESFSANSITIGGLLKGDLALPIPLTIGIEGDLLIATGFMVTDGKDQSALIMPLLARVGWHPNFGVNRLDPYIVGKGGIALFSGEVSDESMCICFGGDIGVRYFIKERFGVFLEGDFNVVIPTADTGGVKFSLFAPSVVVGLTLRF